MWRSKTRLSYLLVAGEWNCQRPPFTTDVYAAAGTDVPFLSRNSYTDKKNKPVTVKEEYNPLHESVERVVKKSTPLMANKRHSRTKYF